MTDAAYNRCLRIAQFAINNVKSVLYSVNKYARNDSIKLRIKNKDELVQNIDKIMRNPHNAVLIYKSKMQELIVVDSGLTNVNGSGQIGELFVKSVVKSRDARVCQKQLIDIMAAEKYMQEAYYYDVQNPVKRLSDKALEYAKNVLFRSYSANFFNNYEFNGTPRMTEKARMSLESIAFDERYSFGKPEIVKKMAEKKYNDDYLSRNDYFLSKPVDFASSDYQSDEEYRRGLKSQRDRQFTAESLMISDLYKGTFAKLSKHKGVRKFVNLRARNRDIEDCPHRNLVIKRQFATIDAMTMHRYIYDSYSERKPPNTTGVEQQVYFFKQELSMYRDIWGNSQLKVIYKNGELIFDDGTVVKVDRNITPHECLHRVNAAYGALFGFGAEDERATDWLFNSLRQSYTTEGVAEYRLAMIDARLKGKLKSN